jgi:hypothetical protein
MVAAIKASKLSFEEAKLYQGNVPDPEVAITHWDIDVLPSEGRQRFEIKGDGNCLFRAIAYCMEGDVELYHKYRMIACDYLLKNQKYFAKFMNI